MPAAQFALHHVDLFAEFLVTRVEDVSAVSDSTLRLSRLAGEVSIFVERSHRIGEKDAFRSHPKQLVPKANRESVMRNDLAAIRIQAVKLVPAAVPHFVLWHKLLIPSGRGFYDMN